MKALDDIEKDLARLLPETPDAEAVIRAAIDKALEYALTKEPSEAMIDVGFGATVWPDLSSAAPPLRDALRASIRAEFRAMQAALLEELKDCQ